MADTTGRTLTYGEVLTASVLLLGPACRPAPSEMVGVLLPSTVAGALANLEPHPARRGPRQPQLHRRRRGHAIRHRAMRHPHGHHLACLPRESENRPAPRHRLHRRPAQIRHAVREAARLAGRAFPPRRVAVTRTPHARFPRRRHLLQRLHRRSQGRHAVPLQPDQPDRSHRAALLDRLQRPHRRRPALLPFLRLHRDHLVPAALRLRRGLPPQPHRRPRRRRAGPKVQGHLTAHHADLLCHLHAQVLRRKNSPACATSWWAPRNFARALPPPSTKNSASNCSKATAAPRCRRSWPSTFPTSARAGTRRPATSPAPWATRCPASPPASSIPSRSTRCRPTQKDCCW